MKVSTHTKMTFHQKCNKFLSAENVQSVLRSIFGQAASSSPYQSESNSDTLGPQGGHGSGGV